MSASDVEHLAPAIKAVLTAPDVNLKEISAKGVRKAIVAGDPSLDPQWVKANKVPIDALIATIYTAVEAAASNGFKPEATDAIVVAPPAPLPSPSEIEHAVFAVPTLNAGNVAPPLPSSQTALASSSTTSSAQSRPTKSKTRDLTDEELARQLSEELNGGGRRTTRGSANPPKGKKKSTAAGAGTGKRARKSKAQIEDDSEGEGGDGGDGTSPRKKQKTGGGGARGGFAKEYTLSEELAAVTGVPTLSRPQISKYVWNYIKANDLQDPRDKREIHCDDKMRAVFHTDRLNMFKMPGLLAPHLYD